MTNDLDDNAPLGNADLSENLDQFRQLLAEVEKIFDENQGKPTQALAELVKNVLPRLKVNPQLAWSIYAQCYDGLRAIIPYQQLQTKLAGVLAQISHLQDQNEKQRPLDALVLGCATGTIETDLKKQNVNGINITGVDFSEEMLAKAREKHPENRYYRADLNNGLTDEIGNPLPGESFDVIVLANVLEFVHNKEALITQIKQALRSNGHLIISTPASDFNNTAIIRTHLQIKGRDFDDAFWQNFTAASFFPIIERICEDLDESMKRKVMLALVCNLAFAPYGGVNSVSFSAIEDLETLFAQAGLTAQDYTRVYGNQYHFFDVIKATS